MWKTNLCVWLCWHKPLGRCRPNRPARLARLPLMCVCSADNLCSCPRRQQSLPLEQDMILMTPICLSKEQRYLKNRDVLFWHNSNVIDMFVFPEWILFSYSGTWIQFAILFQSQQFRWLLVADPCYAMRQSYLNRKQSNRRWDKYWISHLPEPKIDSISGNKNIWKQNYLCIFSVFSLCTVGHRGGLGGVIFCVLNVKWIILFARYILYILWNDKQLSRYIPDRFGPIGSFILARGLHSTHFKQWFQWAWK